MTDQPTPSVCPRCSKPVTRLICGASVYLLGQDKAAVANGEAILGGEQNAEQPAWVCLQCSPEWAEVHRLSWQDYVWQTEKEQAVESRDYELAARLRDRQYAEIRGPLRDLVKKLVDNSPEMTGPQTLLSRWQALDRAVSESGKRWLKGGPGSPPWSWPWESDDPEVRSVWDQITRPEHLTALVDWGRGASAFNGFARECALRAIDECRERASRTS